DQQRAPSVRRREADAERAGQPEPVALAELSQAVRARPYVLEDEADPPRLDAAIGEGARQPRALIRAGSPVLVRGQHVELARARIGRSSGVFGPQQPVLANALDAGNTCQ